MRRAGGSVYTLRNARIPGLPQPIFGAWYRHLKHMQASPWYVAALVSGVTLAQQKIMQEVITLAIFVPFAMLYMVEGLKWNYLWAALCMMGAVYFIFKA